MDAVVEKCVLLKNLPPDLTESDVREILDRATGGPPSSEKYEKIHRHEERKNDVRWIVLFKTKADARDFLSVGDFEDRSSKGRYVVKPDNCSGCIVPKDWLEEDNLPNENEAERYRLGDDNLLQMSITSDEIFTSFFVVQQKMPCNATQSADKNDSSTAKGASESPADQREQSIETDCYKPTSTVPNIQFVYPSNESVSSNKLFGSGLSTQNNGQTAPNTSLSSSPLSSSEMIGDDIENKSKIAVNSERGSSSNGLFEVNSSTDKSKTVSASVLSADLVGSGRVFDYHREENSETEKEVSGEGTMEIKGKTKKTNKSCDVITKPKDKIETSNTEQSLSSTKDNSENQAFRQMMPPQMTNPDPVFPCVNPRHGMYPMLWQNFPMLQTSAQEHPPTGPAIFLVPVYIPHAGMLSTAPATRVTIQLYDEVQAPQSQETKTANSFSSAIDSKEHIYFEITDCDSSQNLYSTSSDELEQTLTKSRMERLANRPMLPLPRSVDSDTDNKKTNVTTPNSNSEVIETDKEHVDKQEEEHKTSKGNRKILVRFFPDEISCEALQLYFEKKTVGVNILSVDVDKKKQQAVIEFESEKDAEKVLAHALKGDKFSLQGYDLEVLEYIPSEFDPLKVFIQNIADTTTDACIVNFVEGRCDGSPKQVIRGETPGTAMLCFQSPPDVNKLQDMCASQTCEGQHWTVTPVERSRRVKVTSLRPSLKDSVSLYFKNKRRSGGGDVQNVEFRENYEDCLVTFRLAADAEHVSERSSHTIDSQEIDVRLHYSCLELDEDFIISIPYPLAFEEIDGHICKFLNNCPRYKERIENAVASHYGRIIWDEDCSFKVECIVDSKDRRGFEKLTNWSDECKRVVEDIVDELMVEESDNIAVEVWPEFKTRLTKIPVPDPQAVVVIPVDSFVVVVGNKGHVPSVFAQVTSVVDDIRKRVKRENRVITMKTRTKKYEMALLKAFRVDQKLSKPLDEFKMDENGEIMCKQKDIDEFLRKLRMKLKTFVSKQVQGFTKEAKDLLLQKAARDYIKAKLNNEKLLGVWDVARGSDLVMYSKNEKDLEEAINILRSSVKMETVSLDATNPSVLHSDDGRKHLQNLESKYEGMVIFHIQSSEVQFSCTDNVLEEIKSEINSFLDLNTMISDFLDVCIGTFSFIVQYEYKKLKSIEEQYSRLSVTVETRKETRKQGFEVSGKKDGCKLAIRHLRDLVDSVAHKDYKVYWPGFDKYIQSPEGVDEIKAVELTEKCVVKVSFEDYRLSQKAKKPDTTKLERGPSEGDRVVKKTLIVGALATQKVDVIVNTTNSNLDLHVGRISDSLLKAAGDQLQWECKSKYPDGLGVGEIAVTSGGALQCKELFHGLLVKWDGGDGHAEKVMVNFVRACLQLASSKQYRSIAFPALGTGALGFPADVVANLMNATVDDFETSSMNTSLKNVVFVIWEGDAETVQAFREALTLHKKPDRKSLDDIKRRYSTLPRADNIVVQGESLTSSISSVKLEVLKGDLTQEHSAAIVNSTTDDLNLNTGAISKAILQAAGDSVQLEATLKKKEFETNGLVCTNSGRLMCEKIIHVRARNGTKGWMEIIQKCLEAAESLGLNSIAFPALGTGGKGVPADRMASVMIKAFKEYIQGSSGYQGCLKSIRIVIFDDKMFRVFITEVRKALDPSQKSKSLFQDLKFWERKVEEPTQETTFHIFGDSKFVIDRAVKKIEEIRKERIIVLIPTVREQLNKSHLNHIWQISRPHKARVFLESSGIVKLIGYGKTLDTAYTKVQEYLDALWKHILDNSALSVGLPKTWSDMQITDKTKVVALNPADCEYTTVSEKFATETSRSGQLTIIKNLNSIPVGDYFAAFKSWIARFQKCVSVQWKCFEGMGNKDQ